MLGRRSGRDGAPQDEPLVSDPVDSVRHGMQHHLDIELVQRRNGCAHHLSSPSESTAAISNRWLTGDGPPIRSPT